MNLLYSSPAQEARLQMAFAAAQTSITALGLLLATVVPQTGSVAIPQAIALPAARTSSALVQVRRMYPQMDSVVLME